MPNSRFLHSMGVASIIAGIVLLGVAQVMKAQPVKRAVQRVTR